jgi:hypothetical protein
LLLQAAVVIVVLVLSLGMPNHIWRGAVAPQHASRITGLRQLFLPAAPAPMFDLDADTVISMLMLVMAIAVALSVVLASSEATVDEDDVFLLTAVSDGGLAG